MRILGYGDIYSVRDTMRLHQAPFVATLFRKRLTGIGPPYGVEQFESLWGEHTCISGEVVSCFAEELIQLYPEAKVILTVRDEDAWLHSITRTFWWSEQETIAWLVRRLDRKWSEMEQFSKLMFGTFYANDVPGHGLRVYREHNAMVKRTTQPKERLLVLDTKQGWGPLCEFLGKEVPEEEFPWVNLSEDHRAMVKAGMVGSLKSWFAKAFVRGVIPASLIALLVLKRGKVIEMTRQLLRR